MSPPRCMNLTAPYLAGRARQLYPLSEPPTLPELLQACAERGAPVEWSPCLRRAGYCVGEPYPLIALRPGAAPADVAHELGHWWLIDNEAHGIPIVEDPESVAERFAALLCPEESGPDSPRDHVTPTM